jgi:hypothetical protein
VTVIGHTAWADAAPSADTGATAIGRTAWAGAAPFADTPNLTAV